MSWNVGRPGGSTGALLQREDEASLLATLRELSPDLLFLFELGDSTQASRVGLGRGTTAQPGRRLDYLFWSPEVEVIAGGPWKGHRIGAKDHDPIVFDLGSKD